MHVSGKEVDTACKQPKHTNPWLWSDCKDRRETKYEQGQLTSGYWQIFSCSSRSSKVISWAQPVNLHWWATSPSSSLAAMSDVWLPRGPLQVGQIACLPCTLQDLLRQGRRCDHWGRLGWVPSWAGAGTPGTLPCSSCPPQVFSTWLFPQGTLRTSRGADQFGSEPNRSNSVLIRATCTKVQQPSDPHIIQQHLVNPRIFISSTPSSASLW